MIFRALKTIEKYNMLEDTEKVTVGFSGGADSAALLHFLYFFVSDKGKKFKVEAVHVNHCLRGAEAIRDENFAKSFCEKFGIKLHIERVNIKDIALKNKIGTEEAGRIARYEIFESLMKKDTEKTATAHTLSDRCETFIFNLLRGASLKGLCSIPPVRGKIIRPLIDVTRAEIEKYCLDNGVEYIHDSTNFERNYTRNKIRLDVIPSLKKINPDFEKSVLKTLDLISEDENFLENQSEKALDSIRTEDGFDAEKFKNLPQCLKNRCGVKIIKESSGISPEKKHVDLLCEIAEKTGAVTLPKNVRIAYEKGIIKISKKKDKKAKFWEYPLKNINNLTERKTNIIIKVIPFSEYKNTIGCPDKKNVIDLEKLPSGCIVRNRRAGDRFTLPFRKVTKSVKKLMNEFKIPEKLRDEIALIAFGNEVLWIEEIGASAKCIANKNTEKAVVIYKEGTK